MPLGFVDRGAPSPRFERSNPKITKQGGKESSTLHKTRQGVILMENKELLEKIVAMQEEIIPAVRDAEQREDVPAPLRHAIDEGEQWADVIQKKDGRDKEARRWPVKQLAKELHEHVAMFDHETRQRIKEYCELVKRLPNDDDAPLGV